MTDQMRKEFEAWAGPYGHDISRSEINPEDYRCQETEWAYDAWQAARRAEPAQAEPVAIPEGWKLVPVNPTPEMLEEIRFMDSITDKAMVARYKAMLEAAPQQEQK